ncbi:MAG TPA: ComEC/Rec2 family competence protein [Brumimicrobium sp.]|nr:ComEC/Rec2 family competence protein [Brumimicrobium sp.]
MLGIIIASYTEIHWIILFTLWITLIFSLSVTLAFGEQVLIFRKWISWNIMFLFFISGMLGYTFKVTSSYENEFSKVYLKDDHIIGEIIEFQKGDNKYDKAIVEIKKLVKPYKEINVQGKILCYIQRYEKVLTEGTVISFQPNVQTIQNKNNPGEFNAEQYWKIKGIDKITFIPDDKIEILGETITFSSMWTKSRNYLKKVIETHINEENQGLVIALSLGDKSSLSMEKRDHFANAGAMHVLAVSGMHVGILLGFISFFFKRIKFLRKRNAYLFCALILLWCFAFITGMSASVVRAVTMFTILGIGQLLGKKFFGLQAIFASALLLLVFNPLLLFDIGFQLSYLAVIGISLFYQNILNLFHPTNIVIKWLWKGTAIGISAQIGTVPLSLFYFNQFPNYFFLTNIGLLILAGVALISVVLLFLLHAIPGIVDVLSWAVNLIFDVLNKFIVWINTLPAEVSTGFTPSILHTVLLYFGIILSLFLWQKGNLRAFKVGLSLLFICALGLVFNREHNKFKEELIVLNHYEKIILLKDDNLLYVLYDEEKQPPLSSLDYLINGYENASGIKAKKLPIPRGMHMRFSKDIKFINSVEGIKLDYFDQQYILAQTVNKQIVDSDYKIVKGDWSPYIPETNVAINTKEKAFIISINDK